ncbi:unnamed protein product [marine sediment metagenome]|uniref:Uncharacterized protein n=1 Tax=marine sediment metagenome TaxID=412755 RepID=X1TJX4_9ZZZZ
MSAERIRVTLTLTKPILDGIDQLVQKGLFMERQEVMRAAIRLFLGIQGIPPFYLEAEG